MSADFVKVYRTFWTGTLRDQPPYARLLFLGMLDLADETGIIQATPSYIAMHVAIGKEDVEAGLEILMSADPDSTSPDEDGARVVKEGPNRYRIVNYRKYYEMNRAQDRREYLAEKQRESRARKKASGSNDGDCQHVSTDVNKNQHVNHEKKRKEKKEKPPKSPTGDIFAGADCPPDLYDAARCWASYRAERKLPAYVRKTWERKFEKYAGRDLDFCRDVDYSIEQGYNGIFPPKDLSKPQPPPRKRYRSVNEVTVH